jgi:hypothetical protein
VARGGVEPPTYRFSGGRSYQLSYLAVHHEEQTTHERKGPTYQRSLPPKLGHKGGPGRSPAGRGSGGSAPRRHRNRAGPCPPRTYVPGGFATQTGLEPATFAVTGRRANQLRHWAMLVFVLPTGFEPALPP